MKIFFRMIISICFVAMIAACGNASKNADNAVQKSNTGTQTSNAAKTGPSLEELAKKEGKVVFYTNTSATVIDPILKLFTKKYGIQVEYLQLRGNEITERIKTESRAGKYIADIADSGPTPMSTFKKGGFFIVNKTERADKLIGTDPEGYFRGTVINVYGILVNTKLVSEKDIPRTWKDLLDPKWKGKILSDDPRAAGGANSVFMILMGHKDYGKPFLENLVKQNITITRQYLENEKALARGEYSIYIPSLGDALNRLQGAPIKWIVPDDLTPVIPLSHGILKDAPHPNAAKLLSDFIISDEAQKLFTETRIPANVDIVPALPEMNIKGKNLAQLTEQEIEEQDTYLDEFSKIFK